MKMKLLAAILICNTEIFAQSIANTNYNFILQPSSAEISALGGANVSTPTNGASIAQANPALAGIKNSFAITTDCTTYPANITLSTLAASFKTKDKINFSSILRYLGYGKIDATDQAGNYTHTFNASEWALSNSIKYFLKGNWHTGATITVIHSHLDTYRAWALALDAGVFYQKDSSNWAIGLTIKNAGAVLKDFSQNAQTKLPFEIQAGVSQKLQHAPFRFSLTIAHLQKWDIAYSSSASFGENLANHVILGAELFADKVFSLKAGINLLRLNNLRISEYSFANGFSFGTTLNLKRFTIQYGHCPFAPAMRLNQFTIDFHKK